MADDDTTQTDDSGDEKFAGLQKRVNKLYAQLQEEKKARAEAESRAEEIADRDKPDLERLTKQVEKLQQERDQARSDSERIQQEAQITERRSIVSDAAAKLGFRNPGDAALFVNLAEIEDAGAAERALKTVAKERDYLLTPKQAEPAGLDRVLTGDQNRAADSKQGEVTEEELKKVWGEQMYQGLMGEKPTSAA